MEEFPGGKGVDPLFGDEGESGGSDDVEDELRFDGRLFAGEEQAVGSEEVVAELCCEGQGRNDVGSDGTQLVARGAGEVAPPAFEDGE